jgi:hypothetical protein
MVPSKRFFTTARAALIALELSLVCVAVAAIAAPEWPVFSTFDATWFSSVWLSGLALFPLVSIAALLQRRAWAPNAAMGLGVALVLWALVRLALRDFDPHLHGGAWVGGAVIALLGWSIRGPPRDEGGLRWAASR